MAQNDINKLKTKYLKKLEGKLGNNVVDSSNSHYKTITNDNSTYSKEYEDFKKEQMPKVLNLYESLVKQTEKIIKIKPDKKYAEELEKNIKVTHLGITPAGTLAFAMLATIAFVILGIFLSIGLPVLFTGSISTFFLVVFMFGGIFIFFYLKKLPIYYASSLRMQASNNMVLCIFYVVTYLRHTSNLELAIKFASDHLSGPLALDLKKVLWDIETEKYDNIKEALDVYLESWTEWNQEFVESFHLIESSLYESSENRRIEILEKSLDVILSETYEKMLHYAHNLKSPITMLHMLGIILPVLGLVILPLAINFMEGMKWYHIAVFYNFVIPLIVYLLGRNILSTRPTGYGDIDISEEIPEFKRYKKIEVMGLSINPLYLSVFILIFLLFLGMLPLLMNFVGIKDNVPSTFSLLGYVYDEASGKEVGPFGMGAALLSLFFPLAFGISIGLYYYYRSKNLIKIRTKSKKLENEFASGIFQLGNRLGDGSPIEVAFGTTSNVMKNTEVGNFFEEISKNIRTLGMNVYDAIFDSKRGAIKLFPSSLIISSMKVLVQSIKKGPRIASNALMNISRYIKEINRVDERLKDLLADIISSMQSQIKFMAPVIAAIVVGVTSMISNILGKLKPLLEQQGAVEGFGNFNTNLFGIGIPTYFFQAIVGIYIVEIVYILTILSNGIENGEDKLNQQYLLGKNMIRSTLTYVLITAIVMVFFNILSDRVIGTLLTG